MADTTTTTPLAPLPVRSPVIDRQTLLVTPVWSTWFEISYRRQGGANAPSNADLDDSLSGTQGDLSQTQDELQATRDELDATQAELQATQSELTAVTERVTTLEGQVATLEGATAGLAAQVEALTTTTTTQGTRLSALEAHLAAIVAAVPVAVTVTPLPTLTDAPVSADALRDNLTSAWEGVLESNDTAVATMANALRDALLAAP